MFFSSVCKRGTNCQFGFSYFCRISLPDPIEGCLQWNENATGISFGELDETTMPNERKAQHTLFLRLLPQNAVCLSKEGSSYGSITYSPTCSPQDAWPSAGRMWVLQSTSDDYSMCWETKKWGFTPSRCVSAWYSSWLSKLRCMPAFRGWSWTLSCRILNTYHRSKYPLSFGSEEHHFANASREGALCVCPLDR